MWIVNVTFLNGHINARPFYVLTDAYRYARDNVDHSRIKRIEIADCFANSARAVFDSSWSTESNALALATPK